MLWTSSLKSSFTHLLGSSAREKLSDQDSRFRAWEESKPHGPGTSEAYSMDTADQDGFKPQTANASVIGDSEIRLTQDITVIRENRSNASFGPDLEANIAR